MSEPVSKLHSRALDAVVMEESSRSISRVERTVSLGPAEQTILGFGVDSRPCFEFFGPGGPASFLGRVTPPKFSPSQTLSSLEEVRKHLQRLRGILDRGTECWMLTLTREFPGWIENELKKEGAYQVRSRVHWAGEAEEPTGQPTVMFDITPWDERALRVAIRCCLVNVWF